MKTKSILLKSIALLLIFLTIFSCLMSCAGDNMEGESSDVTDNASDLNGGSDILGGGNNGEGEGNGDANSDANTNSGDSIVVFANGEYKAKVICSDKANIYAKGIYADVRDLLKKKVGSTPASATDYKAENGPAILVGETTFSESKTVLNSLKEGQAKAVISGDKYVLVWTTEDSGKELIKKVTDIINKNATKDNVTITSKWNVTVTTEPIVKFDESGLKTSIALPDASKAGLKWNVNGRNTGRGNDGSKIYIADGAKADHFTKYVAALKSAGFTAYTTNKLHNNQFATFVTKEQIVHVMFFPAKNVMKVTVDLRKNYVLPGLKSEVAEGTKTIEFVQLGMKQVSGSSENGMGYLVKLPDNRFIVVDAGFAWDSGGGGNSGKFIVNTMKKMQGNTSKPVIAAFIITHIHTDHAGGFMGLANACANQVTIEKLVYNQPSDAQMNAVSNMSGRKDWVPKAITKLKGAGSLKGVVKAHPGMQLFFPGLTITVLGTIDVIENTSHTKMHNGNDSSVVTMFEMYGKKVLLTGDAEPQESKIIRDIYGGIGNKNSVLKADFIQVAHHGYGNTNTDRASGNDQNAINVMASGGVTEAGKSQTYAFIPVGLANGKDPAGYYDAVGHMGALKIFNNDHRLVAYNKNMTVKFNTNGTYTIEKTKHSSGFWIGNWST